LPQVEVRLIPLLAPMADARAVISERPEPAALALTNAQGRYRLTAPHAGLWKVRIESPGFVPAETALKPLIESVELADAILVADSGVKVKVTDAKGAPLAGARVLVRTDRGRYDFAGSPWAAPLRNGTSGKDGTVLLPRGGAERVTLSVSLDGYVTGLRRGVTGGSAALVLVTGVQQKLEVESPDGKPVADVLVAVGSRPHPYAVSDEEGRLTVRLEPGEPVELNLLAEDGRALTMRFEAAKAAQEKPRVLTLPDRALVAGKVIDAESRRPIEGGVVWNAENPLEGVVTDRAGGFVLSGPQGSRMRITAGAPGYLGDRGLEYQFGDDGRHGPTLALRPAAVIEGRITDADGTPVAGAEVTIEKKQTPGMMTIEFGAPSAQARNLSGSRGEFRLSPIDPEERWAVKVNAEGYAPAEQAVGGLEPYGTKSGVAITLSRGQTVSGTVVDESSRPLREVAVSLSPDNTRSMGMMHVMEAGDARVEYTGATDGEGRFEIEGVPEGTFALEARRSGFAKGTVKGIELESGGEGTDLGEIPLSPGEQVQGIVRDRDGLPIEGVEVFVREGGGPQMMLMLGDGPGEGPEPDGVTDPAGWFSVEDLPVGERIDLNFERSGFVDVSSKGIELPRVEPVEAVMEPASNISGIVLDSKAEPIAGAQVNLERRQTIEMGGNVMMTMMMEGDTSDSEGRFLFEDQPPGKISLSAEASGYQESKLKDIEVPKGEHLEGVELKLPAGAVLTGQVFAPDGRPLIGAQVDKVSEEGGPMRMITGNPTDGNGIYRLEGLAPGLVSVEATHDDFPRAVKDIDLDEGLNSLDLHLEGGVEVSGRVVGTSGSPVPDAVARLAVKGQFWGGPQTRTEADGTFEMPGVQDGDYALWIEAEGYAPSSGEQTVEVAGQAVQGLEVRLDSGAVITGTISGLDPKEFAEVSVEAHGGGFGGFDEGNRVDREGNFRIEHVRPGTYEVVAALVDSGRKATGSTTLDEGATEARVDLHFEQGLTLSGKAVQGDSPVVGATVFVEGLELAHTGWGQTDHAGSFSIDGLEPGSYSVNLREYTSGLAYNETVELGTSKEIVLEVPTARVAGRVVDSSDHTPLPGVTLTLNSDDPAAQGRLALHTATTDQEGRFEITSIADGAWRLAANLQGYAAISRPVLVQFDKAVDDLDLKMDATEGVTIEARLPSGAAPSDVTLAVLDPSGGALISGAYPTGENGRVRLSTVPPGEWELIVSAAGSATTSVQAKAPGASVPVLLAPATRLRVTVPDLEESGALATVRLSDAAGKVFHSLGWSGRPQSEWRMAQGQIELVSLPPGAWKVTVKTPDGRSWSGDSVTDTQQMAELKLE
jgi:protocatechuate 3,4-dioxygenase beta subunit